MKIEPGATRVQLLSRLLCLPLAAFALAPACAAAGATWSVRADSVRAHEEFLAGDALRGRGSATPDEAKAAAYVAAQFQRYGLERAPGLDTYLQSATVVTPELTGPPVLKVGGRRVPGLVLLTASPVPVRGKLKLVTGDYPRALPSGSVVAIATDQVPLPALLHGVSQLDIGLLIVRQSAETDRLRQRLGGRTRLPSYLDGAPPRTTSIATLPAAAFDRLAGANGQEASLELPGLKLTRRATTNAVGYLPGTDPKAGVLLLSAHLDHLGRGPNGRIMHGADDDASGTTAVLELAQALAAGPRSRRGILFVCYGSEEIGGFGSRYFGEHPPVPLSDIAANIEFEMIGAQDPKLPAGSLMMTGFDRSNLGEALAAHGALVAADPYPEEHFFQRSDNYQLALRGVVAHTLSGWAVTPVYHQETDTIDRLDIPFMTRAIQSLIEPVRWLAASDFRPEWKAEGRPVRGDRAE